MASNNQNEQEKLQNISEDELKDVTGGYTPHWTDAEGKIHPGVKPQVSTPLV